MNKQSPDHVFQDEKDFFAYIDSIDPMDTFTETKRHIDWGPFIRECRECGAKFETRHPAQFYCEKHQPKGAYKEDEVQIEIEPEPAPAPKKRGRKKKEKEKDESDADILEMIEKLNFKE